MVNVGAYTFVYSYILFKIKKKKIPTTSPFKDPSSKLCCVTRWNYIPFFVSLQSYIIGSLILRSVHWACCETVTVLRSIFRWRQNNIKMDIELICTMMLIQEWKWWIYAPFTLFISVDIESTVRIIYLYVFLAHAVCYCWFIRVLSDKVCMYSPSVEHYSQTVEISNPAVDLDDWEK